jgi:hypothetical protein
MTTYMLVLVLTSTVQIPGFASMADCQAAGNAAQAAVQGTWVPYLKKETPLAAVCVEAPGTAIARHR